MSEFSVAIFYRYLLNFAPYSVQNDVIHPSISVVDPLPNCMISKFAREFNDSPPNPVITLPYEVPSPISNGRSKCMSGIIERDLNGPGCLDRSNAKTIYNNDTKAGTLYYVGKSLTHQGPAPYSGDILQDPELLWTEDRWDEGRVREAEHKIAAQGDSVSTYWRQKYETKAGRYWHEFYKRNADNFYKDRHYLHIVFPELMRGADVAAVEKASQCSDIMGTSKSAGSCQSAQPLYLLEVGCGVGNAILPLLELNHTLHITAFDFAKSAIDILNAHPLVRANPGRVRTAAHCVVRDPLPLPGLVEAGSMDLALCMFVLSAISPADQDTALRKIAAVLKPGGKLLVRDYGR